LSQQLQFYLCPVRQIDMSAIGNMQLYQLAKRIKLNQSNLHIREKIYTV